MLLALGLAGSVLAVGGGIKVFDRSYTFQIEPIEVVELKVPVTSGIKPGQPVEVVYKIINHSTQKHWNVVAILDLLTVGVGLQSKWIIEEGGIQYAPGTPILIPSGYYRTLKVTFFPTEDMTINVRIYRTTSVEGKG